jgi:citrate lyase subunit beta / citryl-CoA lyase
VTTSGIADTGPRRRRSVLWVPADQPHKIERAARSGADVVVLDLEDAVAPDRKAFARDTAAGALRDVDFGGAERLFRVCNGPTLAADIAAARDADGICLPKVEGPNDLAAAHAGARNMLGRVLPILAISAESPLGVLNTPLLVLAATGVFAWMWGSEDLAAALGCRARQLGEPFAGPLEGARNTTVLLAAVTGAQAIDTVYPLFKDNDGLIAECRTAVEAGFSGKGVIHPGQVAPVNESFTPTPEQIRRAQEVVDAFVNGAGVTALDGQMLDLPHLRAAERMLALAE